MTVSLGPLYVFDAVNTFAVPLNLTLDCLSQDIRSVRQPTLKNKVQPPHGSNHAMNRYVQERTDRVLTWAYRGYVRSHCIPWMRRVVI